MMVASDNVLQFPDGARDSLIGRDRLRTLREARDLVAQKLREAVRLLVTQMDQELAVKGDRADEREQRSFYYSSRDILKEQQGRLEGLFAGHWLEGFDAAIKGGEKCSSLSELAGEELALVELDVMDEQLAVRALASKIQDVNEELLFAASRRLGHLAGREDDVFALEHILARSVHAALQESGFSGPLRIEMLTGLESRCEDILGPVIGELNKFLVGRRVLPNVRRTFARSKQEQPDESKSAVEASDVFALLQKLIPGGAAPVGAVAGAGVGGVGVGGVGAGTAGVSSGGLPGGSGSSAAMTPELMAATMQRVMVSLDSLQHILPAPAAVPSTNILREFRGSEVGMGLDHIDAVTVDIVATLFDFIFDDKSVSDPIKALLGRLQIPVLKVAMLDKSFFSSKLHPARRLLDGLSRAAARVGPEMGHEDPLYAHIAALVDRVQNEFKQNSGLFDELFDELNAFLERQERDADERALKAAPLVEKQERKELAAVAADSVLSAWLTSPLPAAISDLLNHEWRTLLIQQYLRDDTEGWESAVAVAGELVASIDANPDPVARKMLAHKLPELVKRIHDGLNRANVPMERRVELLDGLFSLHAAVLRGAAMPEGTVLTEELTAVEPELVAEAVEEEDGVVVQSLSLLDAAHVPVLEDDSDAQHRVDALQRGDWVEFPGGENGPIRYRLSWVSPERGILLFTNPHSPRALSVSPAALARQLEKGEVSIVSVEPIFERAVNRALESLKAA